MPVNNTENYLNNINKNLKLIFDFAYEGKEESDKVSIFNELSEYLDLCESSSAAIFYQLELNKVKSLCEAFNQAQSHEDQTLDYNQFFTLEQMNTLIINIVLFLSYPNSLPYESFFGIAMNNALVTNEFVFEKFNAAYGEKIRNDKERPILGLFVTSNHGDMGFQSINDIKEYIKTRPSSRSAAVLKELERGIAAGNFDQELELSNQSSFHAHG